MENKFEIVFNEMTDGAELKNLPIGKHILVISYLQ